MILVAENWNKIRSAIIAVVEQSNFTVLCEKTPTIHCSNLLDKRSFESCCTSCKLLALNTFIGCNDFKECFRDEKLIWTVDWTRSHFPHDGKEKDFAWKLIFIKILSMWNKANFVGWCYGSMGRKSRKSWDVSNLLPLETLIRFFFTRSNEFHDI